VVFQVQIGEALTHDFFNGQFPVLSFNGGMQNMPATSNFLIDQFFAGTVQMPTGLEPLFNNTYLLQWDLSAVAGPISSFSISFSGVQHAQLYSMALHQSDVFAAVPSPGSLTLLALGGMAALRRRRH
jgi:uncharacterized protein (TIGR03382 family)